MRHTRRRLGVSLGIALLTVLAAISTAISTQQASGSAPRTMTITPRLGMPASSVVAQGNNVPTHATFKLYYVLTSTSSVLICSGSNGSSTSWKCGGKIPPATSQRVWGPHNFKLVGLSNGNPFSVLGSYLTTDLGVFIGAPASVKSGATLTYSLVAANGQTSAATGVNVTDHLPSGVTFVSATSPCKNTSATVSCALGSISKNGEIFLKISVKVTAAKGAKIRNTVTIAGTPDPYKPNDTSTATVPVT